MILYAEKDGKNFDKMAQELSAALELSGVFASYQEIQDRTHGSIVGNIPNPGDPVTEIMLRFIRKEK